ncbi:hypothetical protein EDD22DRAFT_972986 [Suillus occidentalis]|nr:hypothetical protein EDD22DRAFT_972986 [Suillus occidentalis]
MAPNFFTLNTPDNVPEYHNFDVVSQRNKAPHPHKYRFKPYPARGTQDFRQHGPEPQSQLLPQLPSTVCPTDLYINKNLVPSGQAPKPDYGTTSTFGAGGILGPQSMQITTEPANVAPSTDAPFMQAQLPTLPEEATHWPAFHSLNDLQATIMPQNPPAPYMAQSQMQATSNDQGYDQGPVHQALYECAAEGSVQRTQRNVVDFNGVMQMRRQKQIHIHPDEDPDFQLVTKDGEKLYRCLKEQCVAVYLKENSVRRHKRTLKHQNGPNRSSWTCVACGHCFSRGDALNRHVSSERCLRNQKASRIFAAANLAAGNSVVPPPVNLPQGPSTWQGTGLAAQQAPPSFAPELNFSSGSAVQPVVQAPRPNFMTHEVIPFAKDIISPPDVRFSVQETDGQHSAAPRQPSGVPLLPIVEHEAEVDLFGSPISFAPADHVYSESALDSFAPAPSRFEASESYWYKKLEQLVHEGPD